MMAEIVVVTAKCYKPEVDLVELTLLLDQFLQKQGFGVREVMFRIIVEEVVDDSPKIEINPAG